MEKSKLGLLAEDSLAKLEESTSSLPSSSASVDFDGMLDSIRQLKSKMEKHPNGLVMTNHTLSKLRQATESQRECYTSAVMPNAFMGMPIENYPTVKECMDRMMDQREGERLQLVMSEDLPDECTDHPFVKKSVNEMARRFGFDLFKWINEGA